MTIFKESRSTYGTRRIKSVVALKNKQVSRRRIRRVMEKFRLVSVYTRPKFNPMRTKPNTSEVGNRLEQNFSAKRPMEKLTTDLTYVRVKDKWCYCCLVLDLYNREIVGMSVGKHKTADLVMEALNTIPYSLKEVDLFHTDRGSEFVNQKLDQLLEENDIQRSLSAPGTPYDNAVSERTYRSFKAEFINRNKFETIEQLRLFTQDYVHWWNHCRLHSALHNLSPKDFKQANLSIAS